MTLVTARVVADAFCHHMVRALVGCSAGRRGGQSPPGLAGDGASGGARDPRVGCARPRPHPGGGRLSRRRRAGSPSLRDRHRRPGLTACRTRMTFREGRGGRGAAMRRSPHERALLLGGPGSAGQAPAGRGSVWGQTLELQSASGSSPPGAWTSGRRCSSGRPRRPRGPAGTSTSGVATA